MHVFVGLFPAPLLVLMHRAAVEGMIVTMQHEVSTGPADDLALLRRIGAGDRTAMKALYEAHSDALHRFLASRLGDAFEAADVAQETFLEVWRRPGRFEGRSTFRTWLFGVARNKAVDRIRKARRTCRRRAR